MCKYLKYYFITINNNPEILAIPQKALDPSDFVTSGPDFIEFEFLLLLLQIHTIIAFRKLHISINEITVCSILSHYDKISLVCTSSGLELPLTRAGASYYA